MANASGPQRYNSTYSSQVEDLFHRIIARAKSQSASYFIFDLGNINYPEEVVRIQIKDRLVAEGFSNVEFKLSYRDEGAWIEISGNPFAKTNAQRIANQYIEKIERRLDSARMYGGIVTIDINVPKDAQPYVKKAYLDAGWSEVEFFIDRMDGAWVTLKS